MLGRHGGVEWTKSQGLVRSGDRAAMLRGQIATRSDVRAVLAGTIE